MIVNKPGAFGPQENSENLRHFVARLENVIRRNFICPCDACFMKMLHAGNLLANKPGYAYRKLRDASILSWSRATLYEHITRYTPTCNCLDCKIMRSEENNGIDHHYHNSKGGFLIDSWGNEASTKVPGYSLGAETLCMQSPRPVPTYSKLQNILPLQGPNIKQHPYYLKDPFAKAMIPTQTILKRCVVPACCFFNVLPSLVCNSSNHQFCEVCFDTNGVYY